MTCQHVFCPYIIDASFTAVQYIPRNMHTVFALLCFVVVIHWLIFPYPSGLLHWHCGNLTIAPVPAKQPWWIWINTSCEFIMNDCVTTTKQSTTKPCANFLGYTVPLELQWTCQFKKLGVWQYNNIDSRFIAVNTMWYTRCSDKPTVERLSDTRLTRGSLCMAFTYLRLLWPPDMGSAL